MCVGFQQNERDHLNIKAFYIHLSIPCGCTPKSLPDLLTLRYLPRISGNPLDINGSKIRGDSPAFVTLHRISSLKEVTRGAVFGSRERVSASEGVRFEVYLRDMKLLKGIFRRDECDNWRTDCKCEILENDVSQEVEVKEAGVCVAVEGDAEVMNERIDMVAQRRRRNCYPSLEEIPEERELDGEVGWCHCSEEKDRTVNEEECLEMEMEGVRWAVDLGIWAVCLSVGFLVSRASTKSLRRSRLP